jgi:serine protease Do
VVLTNAHNLRGPESTVTFADGRSEVGTVAGADPDRDLAILAVDTAELPALGWTDESGDTGDVVFTVARGAAGHERVTLGTVTATERAFRGPRGRRISGSLEHTAPLARGSSGSPVVDAEGRLLGLNTNRVGEGFYLALPADDELRRRVDQLTEGVEPTRHRLGVGLAPAHVARRLRRSVGLPERDGLLVRVVEDDGPAAEAGLQEGDLIVKAGDVDVVTADDLFDALDTESETLSLTVVRGAEELTVEVHFPAP